MAAVETKVRKAKARLTQEHLDQLMRGEKLVISLKEGSTQLRLELTADEDFRTGIEKQFDAAMKAMDEAINKLEKTFADKETKGIFKSLNTTITTIFGGK